MKPFLVFLTAVCFAAVFPTAAVRAAEPAADPAELVRQLGADEIQVREGAQKRLLEMGLRAMDAVKAGLDSGDPEIRARCEVIHPRLAWVAAAKPPSFDTLVPASTLFFVGSPDVQGFWQRFQKSHVGTLAFHPAARPFWAELGTDMDRHQESRALKYIFTELVPKASGQFMFALTQFGETERDDFAFTSVLQEQDAEAALAGFDRVLKGDIFSKPAVMLEGTGPFHMEGGLDNPDRKGGAAFGVVANALVLYGAEHAGLDPAAKFLRAWRDGPKDPVLSANPAYAAMRKRFPASDLYAFLDVDKLMAAFRKNATPGSDRLFLEGIGVDGLRSVFASLAFRDDGRIEEDIVLQTRDRLRGFLGLFAFKPLDPVSNGLRFAPRDAAFAAAVRLDPAEAYRRIVELANGFENMRRAHDPAEKPRDVTGEWNEQVKSVLGVDAATALAFLGGELSLVGLVDDASSVPMGVLLVESPKPAEFLQLLKAIPARTELGEWKMSAEGGVDVHRLVGPRGDPGPPSFQVCLAATATHVVVATHPAAIRRVLELKAGEGKSVAEDDDVKAALAEMPKGAGALACVNARRLAAWGVAQLKANPVQAGLSEDLAKHLAAMPPADALTKGWKPSVFSVTTGDRETCWKGVGSLPVVNLNLFDPFVLALAAWRF